MSAIAGFWSFDGRPVRPQVDRLLQGQSAYGGVASHWISDDIAFGRKLHSVLPEDRFDRGPIADARHTLVADIRLDNRPELASALGHDARRLEQSSDTQLLFDCLLRWGRSALDHLVGEFAFAWWDGVERRLLLARDVLGHRPLHFHRGKNFFAFASMPSGLHALPEVPRQFDSRFMAETLMLLPRFDGRTHFQHVERVRPAHWVSVEPSRHQAARYWFPKPQEGIRDGREYEEELRRLVDQAVAAQLRGSGRIAATHLSGGLDSSIVTASAASQLREGRIFAFTAVPGHEYAGNGPPGVVSDEGVAAAEVAERYQNVSHVRIPNCVGSPFEALDREHFYHQEPVANLENAVWGRAILSEAQSAGATVLLTGVVGNLSATYTGMEQLGALVRAGRIGKARRLALALNSNGVPWRTISAYGVGPFLPHFAWAACSKLRGWVTDVSDYSAVKPDIIPAVIDKSRSIGFDLSYRPKSDPFEARMDVFDDCDGGNYFKGVLASWGISVREPLADRRIIDFCMSIPSGEFIRDGVPRSLAKRAFADRLPNSVVRSMARGYQSADWYVAISNDFRTLEREAEAIGRCDAAHSALDPQWLRDTISSWPKDGWSRRQVVMRYRYGLLRAVSAGHFMRKVAGTN